ncbi:hypothetical protein IGI04_030493 [Brassica rapa subsp. trilocularis]|uniref:Uncharacterized protein n=1 Tax=Brassica rapa subsp. trilocularis TaxID=1813537 RepID=A0ABQ7LQV5_BRACM|nr:hypothetical protein IGI04_030493 [Brassica rapa subsp. trilocularis]
MANSRVFFSDLKSANCSSVVEARLLRFWVDMLRVSFVSSFKECPHPDDKQRTNLAENRRTTSRCENIAIREALKHAIFKAHKHAIFKAHKHARTQITQEKGRSVKQIRAVSKQRNTRDRGTSSSPPARSAGVKTPVRNSTSVRGSTSGRASSPPEKIHKAQEKHIKDAWIQIDSCEGEERFRKNSCVQTLGGLTHNVSAVCFQPELPIIPTGFEDGTVRIWHPMTLENTLNYALEFAPLVT